MQFQVARKYFIKTNWIPIGIMIIFMCCFLRSESYGFSEIDCYTSKDCYKNGGSRVTSSGNPSYGNQIRINPSAVPTEDGIGIEGILYRDEVDLSLVKGTGRVGAALSPSNSEETFFGPPGIELDSDLFDRKFNSEKFPSQKVTLASAMSLIKKTGSGLRSGQLQLGVMGKYNKLTHQTKPGIGLSGALGPIHFAGSTYSDETQLESEFYLDQPDFILKYNVKTLSWGLSLGSILIDQSFLDLYIPDIDENWTVQLTTVTLMVRKLIMTVSKRVENSSRYRYNYTTQELIASRQKEDSFGGLQINASKNVMLGILYNYYLLQETSVSMTLFF